MNLETLIAIEEIRQLNARYARYADAKRWADLADLFTPDGSFTSYAVDGGVVAEMIGRQAVEETLTKVNEGDVVPIHLFLSHEIELTGPDTAHSIYAMADLIYRGDSYVAATANAELPDFRIMRGWGHYDATYVKTDGAWQYRTLTQTRTRLEFDLITPRHLTHPPSSKEMTMTTLPEPFPINVAQDQLDDLVRRLRDTRWPLDLDNADDYYGISTNELKALVDYWVDGFDWRGVEGRLNQFTNYRVAVNGVPVHFIHRPGAGPAPIPIILSHGWPWSFWDYSKVIEPLADPAAHGGDPEDAFDVVVPSLAGFGFSTPTSGDMNFWKMADIWNALITETLGYAKYAASGTDYGALVTGQLGHKYAANLYGIHLGQDLPLDMFNSELFFSHVSHIPPEVPDQLRAEILGFYDTYASHVMVHMLDAQTITHGLNDSPAGMLAWLLQRWKKWSDKNGDFAAAFPRDHILTNATIYWVNAAIGQSIRSYRNAVRYPWTPSHDRTPAIEAPVGFTFLAGDHYPPGSDVNTRVAIFENGPTRHWFNPVYAKAHRKGGHFVPWENPDAFVDDVRETFRKLR